MSDARAKAEARRAKILARENKQVSAVLAEQEGDEEGEKTPIERPLAHRRRYISTKSVKLDDSADGTDSPKVGNDSQSVDDDPAVESLSEALARTNSEQGGTSPSEVKRPKLEYKAKSRKQIEAEVAANTAKFDENTMKKDDEDTGESATVDQHEKLSSAGADSAANDGKDSEGRDDSANSSKPQKELKLVRRTPKKKLEPANVLKFIRVFFIVVVGTFVAYRSLKDPVVVMQKELTGSSSSSNGASTYTAEGNAFDTSTDTQSMFADDGSILSVGSESQGQGEGEGLRRTWLQWAEQKLVGQLTCSITALSLVWWATNAVSPIVHARFPVLQASKKENFLSTIMSFFQMGIDGFLEPVYNTLGELSLHVTVVIVAATVLYIARDVLQDQQQGSASGAGTLTAVIETGVLDEFGDSETDSSGLAEGSSEAAELAAAAVESIAAAIINGSSSVINGVESTGDLGVGEEL